MALVQISAKVRDDQTTKLAQLAEKYGCSKNAVIIKLIDKARL